MSELDIQEKYSWLRGTNFPTYNNILGTYQAKVCLENAKSGSVLDCPCGDGTITKLFFESDKFDKIIGIDANKKILSSAKDKLPSVEFIHALVEEYIPEEKFDNIFMINVLEHLNDPVAVLSHVKELLKEDGVICIHVPNAEAINRKIAVQMGTLTSCEELSPFDINIAGHKRSYNMDTFVADVEAAGLKIVKTGGIFMKMFSTPQMNWFLENGLWDEGGFGWGRVGGENKDWRQAFCDACFAIGEKYPRECNIVYAVAKLK